MQIILIQTEVEQAIKDYISQRLTLSADTDIQIELAATRGAEGIKAIIDLVPVAAKTANAKKATAPKTNLAATPAQPVPATVTATKTELVPVPAEVELTQEETPAPVVEDEPEVAQEAVTEVEGASEPEVVAVPATPPVRSLFANLRKPQNS